MRKPPIPKIIITPPDDTGTKQKENNSQTNEKDEIWIELWINLLINPVI